MKIKLENPQILSRIVELISELVSEVKLKFNKFGMNITALDPANVAMVGFKLPKSAFVEFVSENEVLGVNLDSLKKVLRRGGTTSSIVFEKKGNLLNIEILDRIKRNFSLSLIDIEADEIDFNEKTEKMQFVSKVDMNSQDLIDAIEDSLVVSDACSFITKNGKFIIEARGTNSLNSSRAEFSGDEAKIEAEDAKARYSLEYLQKFMKGAKLCERTVLNFSQGHPLKIDFKIEHMELSFVLAPRIETED